MLEASGRAGDDRERPLARVHPFRPDRRALALGELREAELADAPVVLELVQELAGEWVAVAARAGGTLGGAVTGAKAEDRGEVTWHGRVIRPGAGIPCTWAQACIE